MKQFSLKEYLKNPMKVITRDGREARIICTDKLGKYPIGALIKEGKNEDFHTYTLDGVFFAAEEDDLDLFFATEKYEGWVNIFESVGDGHRYVGHDCIFESKEKAEKYGKTCSNYITTIKIEWEE